MTQIVHVVGSINIDTITRVTEFPSAGETVLGSLADRQLGGKGANQALAVRRAGGTVVFHGAVGSDPDGDLAIETLIQAGIDVSTVRRERYGRTGAAIITVRDDGDNTIVVASGVNTLVNVNRDVSQQINVGDVVLTQGEVPVQTIVEAAARAEQAGARFVLNLAPVVDVPAEVLAVCDPLIVNEHEAAELGLIEVDEEDWTAAARRTIGRVRSIAITLGAKGAAFASRSGSGLVDALPVTVVDTIGAGDAFTGGLAAALAAGTDLEVAVQGGVREAAVVVSVSGANV